MTQNTKTDIVDGEGATEPNYVYPTGPGTAVFRISAGTGNLEVCCDNVDSIRTGGGEPMWAIVAAAVVATEVVHHFSEKVSAVRLANAGGVGTLQVTWKS
jgi:hypothetical protein